MLIIGIKRSKCGTNSEASLELGLGSHAMAKCTAEMLCISSPSICFYKVIVQFSFIHKSTVVMCIGIQIVSTIHVAHCTLAPLTRVIRTIPLAIIGPIRRLKQIVSPTAISATSSDTPTPNRHVEVYWLFILFNLTQLAN